MPAASLLGGDLGEALSGRSCSAVRSKTSGSRADQPLADQQPRRLLAQPLDVEGVARGEVDDAADELGRAAELFGQTVNGPRSTSGCRTRGIRPASRHSPPVALAVGVGSRRSITCGMTSPARCTRTQSPSRTSFRATSSRLWRVARETVTPPSSTGRSSATGVTTPVRPTEGAIASTRVISFLGGNLKAKAQRGWREVAPSARGRRGRRA
jgi:hypothetical protein